MGLGGLNLSLCEFPMETLRWGEGSSPGDRKLPQAIGNLTSPFQPVSALQGLWESMLPSLLSLKGLTPMEGILGWSVDMLSPL